MLRHGGRLDMVELSVLIIGLDYTKILFTLYAFRILDVDFPPCNSLLFMLKNGFILTKLGMRSKYKWRNTSMLHTPQAR
jgi:hypothetical protein